jgi:predicted nucleic acid-binding protein
MAQEVIFVDTWAWVALISERDAFHAVATAYQRMVLRQRPPLVTTDYVLIETITQLSKIVGTVTTTDFIDGLLTACAEARMYRLVRIDEARFRAGLQLRKKYADKPDISFTDLTSMAVMQEFGITDIFTGDAHFEHVGLGFRRVPAQA